MTFSSPCIIVVLLFLLLSVLPCHAGVSAEQVPQQLLDQAQQALDSNRLEEALPLLREILNLDSKHPIAREALVDVLMQLMRWDEAQKEIAVLRSLHPKDAQAALLAATVAFRIGEFPKAIDLASETLNLQDPPNEALRIRALSRFMTQDYEGFMEDMRTLIQLEPQNPEPHYHIGRYYFETQIFEKAEKEFEAAIEKAPRHYRAIYYLGWCQQAGGDLDAARDSYLKSIKIIREEGVSYGWPFSDLGEVLMIQGDYEEGLSWLYSAVRNDPDSPYVHFKYASALFKKETTTEVETELQKAVELDPGYTEAYYLLASYYRKTGDRELAMEALKKFQELRANPVPSLSGVRRN